MPSVFRARNGAGFWGTSVGGTAGLEYLAKKRPPRTWITGRGVWYKPAPKFKPRDVNGTQEHTTSLEDRRGASPLRPLVLAVLREYHVTGLTTPEIADVLKRRQHRVVVGNVSGVIKTLATRGLVRSIGKVWCARGKHGQRIHQWKLTEKLAEAAD